MKRFAMVSLRERFAGTIAIAFCVAAMAFANSANASVLNMCWNGHDSAVYKTYAGPGAAPDSATSTFWNNVGTFGQDNSSTLTGLKCSNSAAVADVSIQLNNVYSFTSVCDGLALFNGQLNASTGGTSNYVSLDINGLDNSKTYDLYLYSARTTYGADSTDFVVNGVTKTLVSTNVSNFVPGDNYTTFLAQSPTSGTLRVTFGGGTYGGVFSAMQIVGVSDVPEPGTVIILSTGLIGLLAYAWRKRK